MVPADSVCVREFSYGLFQKMGVVSSGLNGASLLHETDYALTSCGAGSRGYISFDSGVQPLLLGPSLEIPGRAECASLFSLA